MKKLKKLTALVLAAVMILAMSAIAFAAVGDVTTLPTNLYKDGEYDSENPDDNLSMGDGAVKDTTYTENEDGTYTARLNFEESFTAYYITSYLKNVEVDLDGDGDFDDDVYELIYGSSNTSAIVGIEFDVEEVPEETVSYNANFTIQASLMPISASGDIVINP